MVWSHDKPSITWGNQKWKGAAPNLSKRAIRIIIEVKVDICIIKHLERIIRVDARAWIKKYFRAASEEYGFILVAIRGIKDIRLSSNPIQAPNQDVEDTERIVPIISVEKKNREDIGKII